MASHTYGSRPFLYAKRAHFPHSFRILCSSLHACGKLIRACVTDSVYCTRAVNLYAHV